MELLEITAGDQSALVSPSGAALRSWRAGGRERLDGFGAASDYRGDVLVPWPNRMRDGRYAFGGADHQAPINEPARHCALHGLATGIAWRVDEHAQDRLGLHVALERAPGYPFSVRVEVAYHLGGDGLAVTLAARNTGDGPAPFGAGFHPYVLTGGTRLDVPASAHVPLDPERMLPTGPPVAVAAPRGPVGDRAINACYTDLARERDGLARVHVGEVTLWQDEAFPFVMVYTADEVADPAQRRRSIAVEPMTCAPDAFNTGLGLRVLAPGERLTGRWGLTYAG
jgi:aldose 1-epimerase